MSSPDPLNDSLAYQSPAKPRRSSRAVQSLPPQRSSPKKQTFQLDVGNELSPQKLRVTVEAEGSDIGDENAEPSSPTRKAVGRRRERTTTTTIPVKGLSDTEREPQAKSPKKGRGRPRKSVGTPIATTKGGRASTPTQKNNRRRKSIGSLKDGDDEDDTNYQMGQEIEIGRGKGRSRSQTRKGASRKSTSAAKETDLSNQLASSTTSKSSRGRKKALRSEETVTSEEGSGPDGQDMLYDLEGELEQVLLSRASSSSAYSTVRSTTATDEEEPDVLLARFEPGSETPQRSGWSSPLGLVTRQPPNSRSKDNAYPSPLVSPDKLSFSPAGSDIIVQSSHPEFVSEDLEYHDVEYEEGVDEMPEFDTILESEGFSMISVDSVPSLRKHLSSPPDVAEMVSKTTASQRLLEVQHDAYEDSFSAVPEEILAAATPARKSKQVDLDSLQQSEADNTFSGVAPSASNGTALTKKTLVTKLLSKRRHQNSLTNNSFSTVDQESLEAATPVKPLSNTIRPNIELQQDYEDSFSTISDAVLEAATPAAAQTTRLSEDKLNVPSQQLTTSHVVGSSPGRLLTPDETPSPPADDSAPTYKIQPAQWEGQSTTQRTRKDSSFLHSQMQSSPPLVAPPRFTYTAHLRQHRQLNPSAETPSIVFSSPSLPPPILAGRGQLAAQVIQTPRPPLSPIARTGQVLQNITVLASSRSRSQSLGSPFKSPVAERRSSSILAQGSNPPSHERQTGKLPSLDLNSQFVGFYSQRSQDDDPFNTNSRGERSPSPEQKQQYTLDLPEKRRCSDPRLDNLRSFGNSVRSDDAMSWQAEQENSVGASNSCQTNTSTQQSSNLAAEQRWAAERVAVSKQIAAAGPQNIIVIDSDDEKSKNDQEEGDEDFGLLLETLNSSSPVKSKEPEPAITISERPRRAKIPSPWRKDSRKLVYNDELARYSSPVMTEKPTFSKNIEKEVSSQPITVRRVISPEVNNDEDIDADLSGWQIPQKANFKPRVRENTNLDLSALLTASPMKALPTLSSTSNDLSQPSSSGKSSLFQASHINSIQKDISQPSGFTPIPQKAGFKPMPRADPSSPTKQNLFQSSLFGRSGEEKSSSSFQPASTSLVVQKALSNSSLSKSNMPSAQNLTSAQCSPLVSDDGAQSSLLSNDNKENQAAANSRTQKWAESLKLSTTPIITPMVTASTSPTKSCLRSPLKTPSAVSSQQTPSKGVTFVSSSPIPSSPPEVELLSATEWSKSHWRLLETIVQSWKPENQNSPLSFGSGSGSDSSGGNRKSKRRNSTRVISKLLGKKVTSGEDQMRLEQWHLEAVDEFRGVVPGWEEKKIAMRVFALCVGEKQRIEKAKREAEIATTTTTMGR